MAKQTTKYYQECDFCHKEFEVSKDGMSSITLPGYLIRDNGARIPQWVTADICPECTERLREHLAKVVDIMEDVYYGLKIHWLDDEGESK